jgi:3-methyladenine DNA glycosylase AlkD
MSGEVRSLNPKKAARDAIAFMKSHSSQARVDTLQKYFKDPIQAYGVDYPAYKVWMKGFVKELKKGWVLQDAVEYCDIMVKDPHMEAPGNGFQVVAAFVDEAGPELVKDVHRWLETSCGNWGLVDNLVPSVLSPLIRMHPLLAGEVKGWTSSDSLWVRRGSAVAFVSLVKHEEFMDTAYAVATDLLDDKEDLIHKAVGWMLREAGKVDRDRLEDYLLEKGPRLPRTTLRYAIEKFPKEDRKRLLEATNG